MKKLLSLALALVMVLTLSVAVAAEDPADMTQVTIDVTYTATNTGTTSPAETFSFSVVKTSVSHAAAGVTTEDMPNIAVGGVAFAEGEAAQGGTMVKPMTITLPTVDDFPSVGIYTYTIQPQAGTTAGVAYYTKDIRLVITVIEAADGQRRIAAIHTESGEPGDTEKSNDIEYTYSAGSLSVTKNVAGNLGDREKYFAITVTLTGEAGKTYADSYPVTGGSKLVDGAAAATISVGTSATFYLKHGETLTIANLPYGVTYTVTEADYTTEGYDDEVITYDDTNKKIDSAADTVTITNNKGTTVDTGVVLDSLPYILLIAVAVVGVVAFTAKKRTID